jgi:uncharacterized Zn finger protein
MAERKYIQVYDGEWVQPVMRGYLMRCCDCGLVHKTDFRIAMTKRGKPIIQFRVRRDRPKTAATRRAQGITVKRR